ncbi:hypothetical protein PHLGIDRAFT_302688 [Phlebiopsis gigantea 11061_1 CR5-6]|uniref:Uncharacterized protein n=1 Tax=Phlebiopsis gigantea (strain 11061_1 CR5-6) TaxID=745531 RepID=A0A0C3NWI5_PHLG1|nr:hypothetical protein PHLGIDRAFT_302688 [Phlebiopsis gigantea 11061_1 CR5-6]
MIMAGKLREHVCNSANYHFQDPTSAYPLAAQFEAGPLRASLGNCRESRCKYYRCPSKVPDLAPLGACYVASRLTESFRSNYTAVYNFDARGAARELPERVLQDAPYMVPRCSAAHCRAGDGECPWPSSKE